MLLENLTASKKTGAIMHLTFDIPAQEAKTFYNRALNQFAQNVAIPGFRKGKAPAKMIEERYASRIMETAEDDTLREALREAVKKEGPPSEDLLSHRIEEKSDFSLSAPMHVEVRLDYVPAFEPKGYKKVKLVKKAPVVSDETMDAALDKIANEQAQIVPVDRAAAVGDIVAIDFEGFKEDGSPIPHAKGENVPLGIGEGRFIPGFEEALVGAKADEARDFTITFPADYSEPSLQNVPATFKTKVRSVKERRVPEIDDELAKDAACDSLEDLKSKIRESHLEEAKREVNEELEADLLEILRKENPIPEIPEVMLEAEIERRRDGFLRMIAGMRMKPEDYFKIAKTSREELDQSIRERAIETVHTELILRAVAKAENIKVTEQELSNMIAYAAHQQGKSPQIFADQLIEEGKIGLLKFDILKRKALQFILEDADIEDRSPKESGLLDSKGNPVSTSANTEEACL